MEKNNMKFSVSFNSPVILSYAGVCLLALILGIITRGTTNHLFFSVYRSSLLDPLTYFRFFGHICGHVDWQHFIGNMMLILVVGPLLEEKYGSLNILFVILATALITGLINFMIFPRTQLLGASGVVFAFILLSSFTSITQGSIPATFILVAFIYLGQQIFDAIFVKDHISNMAHIVGGCVGGFLGYVMYKKKMNKY